MKKVLSCFLWIFYVAIILYVFFAVLNINTLENCASAIIFECVGFIALAYCIFFNIVKNPRKVGYFVPLVMTTIIYSIILDVVNIVCITTMNSVCFTLLHMILLFAYCLVSIPVYLMGRR